MKKNRPLVLRWLLGGSGLAVLVLLLIGVATAASLDTTDGHHNHILRKKQNNLRHKKKSFSSGRDGVQNQTTSSSSGVATHVDPETIVTKTIHKLMQDVEEAMDDFQTNIIIGEEEEHHGVGEGEEEEEEEGGRWNDHEKEDDEDYSEFLQDYDQLQEDRRRLFEDIHHHLQYSNRDLGSVGDKIKGYYKQHGPTAKAKTKEQAAKAAKKAARDYDIGNSTASKHIYLRPCEWSMMAAMNDNASWQSIIGELEKFHNGIGNLVETLTLIEERFVRVIPPGPQDMEGTEQIFSGELFITKQILSLICANPEEKEKKEAKGKEVTTGWHDIWGRPNPASNSVWLTLKRSENLMGKLKQVAQGVIKVCKTFGFKWGQKIGKPLELYAKNGEEKIKSARGKVEAKCVNATTAMDVAHGLLILTTEMREKSIALIYTLTQLSNGVCTAGESLHELNMALYPPEGATGLPDSVVDEFCTPGVMEKPFKALIKLSQVALQSFTMFVSGVYTLEQEVSRLFTEYLPISPRKGLETARDLYDDITGVLDLVHVIVVPTLDILSPLHMALESISVPSFLDIGAIAAEIVDKMLSAMQLDIDGLVESILDAFGISFHLPLDLDFLDGFITFTNPLKGLFSVPVLKLAFPDININFKNPLAGLIRGFELFRVKFRGFSLSVKFPWMGGEGSMLDWLSLFEFDKCRYVQWVTTYASTAKKTSTNEFTPEFACDDEDHFPVVLSARYYWQDCKADLTGQLRFPCALEDTCTVDIEDIKQCVAPKLEIFTDDMEAEPGRFQASYICISESEYSKIDLLSTTTVWSFSNEVVNDCQTCQGVEFFEHGIGSDSNSRAYGWAINYKPDEWDRMWGAHEVEWHSNAGKWDKWNPEWWWDEVSSATVGPGWCSIEIKSSDRKKSSWPWSNGVKRNWGPNDFNDWKNDRLKWFYTRDWCGPGTGKMKYRHDKRSHNGDNFKLLASCNMGRKVYIEHVDHWASNPCYKFTGEKVLGSFSTNGNTFVRHMSEDQKFWTYCATQSNTLKSGNYPLKKGKWADWDATREFEWAAGKKAEWEKRRKKNSDDCWSRWQACNHAGRTDCDLTNCDVDGLRWACVAPPAEEEESVLYMWSNVKGSDGLPARGHHGQKRLFCPSGRGIVLRQAHIGKGLTLYDVFEEAQDAIGDYETETMHVSPMISFQSLLASDKIPQAAKSNIKAARLLWSCACPLGHAPAFSKAKLGFDYRGTVSKTASGKTCQKWTSQTPHQHWRRPEVMTSGGLGDHNYCRNPDNEERGPWCYTTDLNVEREYCNITDWDPMQKEYRGTVAKTVNGQTCREWTDLLPGTTTEYPDHFSDHGLGKHNYCRNPTNDRVGAWCYTSGAVTTAAPTPAPTAAQTNSKGAAFIGCYKDSEPRAMSYKLGEPMSVTACRAGCLQKGYSFAAAQNGAECYCGNSYDRYGSASDSDCNKDCKSGSGKCGGPWRNQVYHASDAAVSSRIGYIGCYEDKPDRAMPHYVGNHYSITQCRSLCIKAGFDYAGLQAGRECFCGDTYDRYGSKAESDCRDDCSSGSGKCGGGWRLSVYTAVEPATVSDYVGCYKDDDPDRAMPYKVSGNFLSIANCKTKCLENGYTYAGLQAGGWDCWCGHSYDKHDKAPESECNQDCSSGGGKCGGGLRNSVFQTTNNWAYCKVTWPECQECKAGTYRSEMDQESCQLCATGTFSSSGAEECTSCPRNTYADKKGMAKCNTCPEGTIGTVVGATSKTVCQECEDHEVADTLAGVCVPCPHNTYPVDGVCQPCPLGKVRLRNAASQCTACPEGEEPKYILSGQTGNKQRDYRGTVSVTQSDKKCSNWLHSTTHNPKTAPLDGLGDHNNCRNPLGAKEGAWCFVDGTKTAELCNITTNSIKYQEAQGTCQKCPVGMYRPPSSPVCMPVPRGSYQDVAGQSYFKQCPCHLPYTDSNSDSKQGATSESACKQTPTNCRRLADGPAEIDPDGAGRSWLPFSVICKSGKTYLPVSGNPDIHNYAEGGERPGTGAGPNSQDANYPWPGWKTTYEAYLLDDDALMNEVTVKIWTNRAASGWLGQRENENPVWAAFATATRISDAVTTAKSTAFERFMPPGQANSCKSTATADKATSVLDLRGTPFRFKNNTSFAKSPSTTTQLAAGSGHWLKHGGKMLSIKAGGTCGAVYANALLELEYDPGFFTRMRVPVVGDGETADELTDELELFDSLMVSCDPSKLATSTQKCYSTSGNVYHGSSHLCLAAKHSGYLDTTQTNKQNVLIKLVPTAVDSFTSSIANGVTSSDLSEVREDSTSIMFQNATISSCGLTFNHPDDPYVGCYIDAISNGGRAVPHRVGANSLSTTECRNRCRTNGHAYAGLQYGRECWCGDSTFDKHGKAPDSDCNVDCGSLTAFGKCGGTWRNSVYRTNTSTTTTTTTTSSGSS